MKHLLLTRFQGALLGGNTIYLNPQHIAPNQLTIDATPAIIAGIDSLTRCGDFNDSDWISSTSGAIHSHYKDRNNIAIIAMVPVILFFHADRIKLRAILLNISQRLHLDWETCSSAIAIGYIISRSLTETCTPKSILSQLSAEMENLHPLLLQQLSTIHRLLHRPTSLRQISQELTTDTHPTLAATVIAIYCFLSTPEEFSLTILRAYHSESGNRFTCAIAGVLSGAYNSLTGIPLNGLIATQGKDRLLKTGEDLLNLWAGVGSGNNLNPTLVRAFAPPMVMQKRDL
jgi:hypothetical protein